MDYHSNLIKFPPTGTWDIAYSQADTNIGINEAQIKNIIISLPINSQSSDNSRLTTSPTSVWQGQQSWS